MDADIISGTASAGTIGMPVGSPLGLKLAIPTHTVFSLVDKYVEIRLRQEGGTGPVLFTASTTGSFGSITSAGTTDQYVEFNIPTSTASEHDSSTTLGYLAKAGRKYDFAVDFKTSAASDTALRVQGELHWITAEGEFSTSATTGSTLTVNVSSGSATVALSVTAAGAQGPQGDTGATGAPGQGVAAGGTTGQLLAKASASNYDTEWVDASGVGTVTSVAVSGSDGIQVDSGSPITTSGTIALGVDAATMRTHLNVENGATADQTPAEILTAIKTVDGASSGLDADLLDGNEAAAFGTAAQGALADTAIQPSDISGLTGGTTGQIATKASGDDYDLTWSDDLTVPGLLTADHIHGNLAGTLYIHVKNTSGGTLTKGTPVYVTGHVGVSDRAEVQAADQSDPAKMPAIALLAQDLLNNGEGDAVIVGEIRTFDTATPGWAINDELFVGTSGLTSTRPTSGTVQPVATVGRLHASTGVLVINCQGQRTPDETFATAAQGALADSAQQPPAEGAFVDGDKTKLDGIESGADVTDTANVTAAGALMDSEVTNLAAVKAFDPTAYATAAQGALADSAIQSGDIDTLAEVNAIITDATLIDTTDSRLSDARTPTSHASTHTNGTDDIQSATNAQKGLATAAHIAAIEANTAKLTCDTTNVTSAGALMDSEVTNLAAVKAFDPTDYATSAQGTLADSATQPGDNISTLTNDSSFISNVSEDTTPQLGGSLDVNGNKIVSTANGNIDIEPNGTGNVLLGNMTFDADQTIGAGQDDYVLTYDNGTGLISLEAASGGGGGISTGKAIAMAIVFG